MDQVEAADPTLFDTDPLQLGEVHLHSWMLYMWRQADHPAIWMVPALGFAAILGNSMVTHFGRATSEAHHLFSDVTLSGGAMTSCVMSWRHTCTSHVTFCYKRSANASFEALFGSFGSWFILQVRSCHPHTAGV